MYMLSVESSLKYATRTPRYRIVEGDSVTMLRDEHLSFCVLKVGRCAEINGNLNRPQSTFV